MLKRLFKWLGLLAALLLVGEVVVRLIPGTGAPRRINSGFPEGLWQPDAELGHTLSPDFRGAFIRHERYPIQTDGLGRRVPPVADRSAAKRLLVLGDSLAFGKYVRAEECFAALLARRLTGWSVECHAVPCYSLPHYELLAERLLGEPFSGAILLCLSPDDLEPLFTHGDVRRALRARGAPEGFPLPPDDPQNALERETPPPFPLRHSALYSEARKLWGRFAGSAHPERHDPHRRYMNVQLRRCEDDRSHDIAAGLINMARLAQSRGLGFAAVAFPDGFELAGEKLRSASGLAPADLFARAAERASAPFLDLRVDFLERRDPRGLILSNDVMHLSPRGHREVAGILLEWLEEQRLL